MAVALTHLRRTRRSASSAWRAAALRRSARPSPAGRRRSSSGTTRQDARDEAAALGGNAAASRASGRGASSTAWSFRPACRSRIRSRTRSSGCARTAGVEIVCDIELLWREAAGHGALRRGHRHQRQIHDHGADRAYPGGGRPRRRRSAAISAAPRSTSTRRTEGRIYVLEMSSYQLDLTRRFRPDVAVWLNLTPDHLDRHGDMAGYAKAKARIFANMRPEDTAIVGIDEPEMQAVAAALRQARTAAARHGLGRRGMATRRSFVDAVGALVRATGDGGRLARRACRRLRGAHNWQNAAVAWRAARALGLDGGRILAAMATLSRAWRTGWRSLGRRGRVLFVNDSKATNADAAAQALATLRADLLDRRRPGEGRRHRAACAAFFPRIAKAYLIGAAADAFSATLARPRAARHRRRPRQTRVAHGGGGCRARPPARAGRAPLARLRLLRPVRRFRGARRGLPPRLRCTRCTRPWRRSHDQPRAPLAACPTGGGPSTGRCSRWCCPAAADRLRASPSRRARRSPSGSASTACISSCATPSTRRSPALLMIGLSFLTPRQVRRAALVLLFVCLALMVAGALRRRGDQGLAALAVHRRHVGAAVGVHQAGLHRHHRLALRRGQPPARRAGHACSPSCSCSSPRRCSSPSPISARPSSSSPSGARSSSSPACRRLIVAGARRRSASPGLLAAYYVFPHVAGRINRFLDPESGDNFQIMHRHAVLRARRLVGHRAGRGHHEARPAGLAYRLRLRRGRRGVRHPPLPADRGAVLRPRHARPDAGASAATAPSSAWRSPGSPRRSACRPSSTWA